MLQDVTKKANKAKITYLQDLIFIIPPFYRSVVIDIL